MLSFTCAHCGQKLKVADEAAGKNVRCPFCRVVISAPELAAPSPQPAPRQHSIGRDHGETLSKPTLKIDQEELIDMTAMVDIVFFLLIFFLVTSMQAVHSSMPTPPPEMKGEGQGAGAAKSIEEIEAEGDAVIVHIRRDDKVEVDGVPMADLSDLPGRLQMLRAKGGARTGLLVVGHGDASHGIAVTVLDAGYEAGMERCRLAVSDNE